MRLLPFFLDTAKVQQFQAYSKLFFKKDTQKSTLLKSWSYLVTVDSWQFSSEQIEIFSYKLYYIYPITYPTVFEKFNIDTKLSENDLSKNYTYYRKPITPSEAQKISIKVIETLKKYDIKDSLYYGKEGYEDELKKMEIVSQLRQIKKWEQF